MKDQRLHGFISRTNEGIFWGHKEWVCVQVHEFFELKPQNWMSDPDKDGSREGQEKIICRREMEMRTVRLFF